MGQTYDVFRTINGSWRENCFVVRSRAIGAGIVIDPGSAFEETWNLISRESIRVLAILLTHAHYDHVDGVTAISEKTGAALHVHEDDLTLLKNVNVYALAWKLPYLKVPSPDVLLRGGELLECDDLAIEVLHTPGHTKGSVSYIIGRSFFVGDTILPHSVGRVDLPGGDQDALRASVIKSMSRMTGESILYPGHGEPTNLDGLKANSRVRQLLDVPSPESAPSEST